MQIQILKFNYCNKNQLLDKNNQLLKSLTKEMIL